MAQKPRRTSLNDIFNNDSTDPRVAGPSFSSAGIRDRRIRLSPKPAAFDQILGPKGPDNILNPLRDTAGMVFPFTPMINESTSVNYDMYELTHSNQPIAAFKNVGNKEIQVAGMFTAQNDAEGRYALAVLHYLRTVSKMYFGARENSEATRRRGTPPPILMFNGYGTAVYHNVPVILNSYNIEMPNDVDYVNVNFDSIPTKQTNVTASLEPERHELSRTTSIVNRVGRDATAWVPTKFNISMTLTVQNNPKRLRKFDLDKFRTGGLLKEGGWL